MPGGKEIDRVGVSTKTLQRDSNALASSRKRKAKERKSLDFLGIWELLKKSAEEGKRDSPPELFTYCSHSVFASGGAGAAVVVGGGGVVDVNKKVRKKGKGFSLGKMGFGLNKR